MMDEQDIRKAIDRHWAASAAGDQDAEHEIYHDDAVCEYPQSGEVIINPTEDDGTFGVTGLPPGEYELRVFEPGRINANPIASKQVTLAAGRNERIEIRLGSGNPGGAAAGSPAKGTPLASTGINWTAVVIAAMVLGAALVVFFAVRAQRRPGE